MKRQLRNFTIGLALLSAPSLALADQRSDAQAQAQLGQQNSLNNAFLMSTMASKTDDKKMQAMLFMMMAQQQMQAQAFAKNKKDNSSDDKKSSSDDKKDDKNKVPQPEPLAKSPITPVKPEEQTLVTLDGLKPKKLDTDPVTSSIDIPNFVPPQISLNKKPDAQPAASDPHPGGTSVPGVIGDKKGEGPALLNADKGPNGTGPNGDISGGSGLIRTGASNKDLNQANVATSGSAEEAAASGRGAAKVQEGAIGGGGGEGGGSEASSKGGSNSDDFFNMLMKKDDAGGDAPRDLAAEGGDAPSQSAGPVMNIFQIAQVRYQYAAYKEKRVLVHAR